MRGFSPTGYTHYYYDHFFLLMFLARYSVNPSVYQIKFDTILASVLAEITGVPTFDNFFPELPLIKALAEPRQVLAEANSYTCTETQVDPCTIHRRDHLPINQPTTYPPTTQPIRASFYLPYHALSFLLFNRPTFFAYHVELESVWSAKGKTFDDCSGNGICLPAGVIRDC